MRAHEPSKPNNTHASHSNSPDGLCPRTCARWLCLTTAIVTIACLFVIHRAPEPSYLTGEARTWQLYTRSQDGQPAPISNDHGKSYAAIETLLRPHYLVGAQDLRVNEQLLASLRKSYALLSSESPSKTLSLSQLDALGRVLEHAFPGDQGRALAEMIRAYHHYDSNIEQIDDPRARQTHYFGKQNAEQLFRQQNALQDYLAARAAVRNQGALSLEEKHSALEQLRKTFEATIKSPDDATY